MNAIFKPYLRKHVMVFFDDILVFSKSKLENLQHLQSVLEVMRIHQLYAKSRKCHFAVASVEYLGHVITPGGVRTDKRRYMQCKLGQLHKPLSNSEVS